MELLDDRLHISIDANAKVKVWEIFILEDPDSTSVELAMVLARYLANGSGFVSPELPQIQAYKMTREERIEYKHSKAFDILSEYEVADLTAVAKDFVTKVQAKVNPN